LKRTLYGLRHSPKHWYDKIQKIFHKLGLQQNAYNPCLFIGNILRCRTQQSANIMCDKFIVKTRE
jgi:hypothetical protein